MTNELSKLCQDQYDQVILSKVDRRANYEEKANCESSGNGYREYRFFPLGLFPRRVDERYTIDLALSRIE